MCPTPAPSISQAACAHPADVALKMAEALCAEADPAATPAAAKLRSDDAHPTTGPHAIELALHTHDKLGFTPLHLAAGVPAPGPSSGSLSR